MIQYAAEGLDPNGQTWAEPASAQRQVIVLRADPGEQHRERLTREFPDLEFPLATTSEALSSVLEAAEALIGGSSLTAELLAGAPRLRWVQATSAGIENFLFPELRHRSTITLTNFSGIDNSVGLTSDHDIGQLLQELTIAKADDAFAAEDVVAVGAARTAALENAPYHRLLSAEH